MILHSGRATCNHELLLAASQPWGQRAELPWVGHFLLHKHPKKLGNRAGFLAVTSDLLLFFPRADLSAGFKPLCPTFTPVNYKRFCLCRWVQRGLHCQQEPAGGSILMKEQVWDTELFPKDP